MNVIRIEAIELHEDVPFNIAWHWPRRVQENVVRAATQALPETLRIEFGRIAVAALNAA